MTPRLALSVAAVVTALAVVSTAFTLGVRHGGNVCRAEAQIVKDAAELVVKENELIRLTLELERDQLARELEDAANADPVTSPGCLPADRVRRLNRIR